MKNSNFTQEEMLLDAYKRMQQSILKLAEYMAAHIDYIDKGQGHMAYGDIDYVLNTIMSDINWNIRKISTQKVNITRGEMKKIENDTPMQVTSAPQAQPKPVPHWTTTSTDGNNYQFESKKPVKKITESQLKTIVAESVKEVLSEIGDTPRGLQALNAVQGRAMKRMNQWDKNRDKYRQTFDNADDAIRNAQQQQIKNGRWSGDVYQDSDKGFQYGYRKG